MLSTQDVAKHFGMPAWLIRRLYQNGMLPPARRFRGYRLITPDELPTIKDALRKAGYLADGK